MKNNIAKYKSAHDEFYACGCRVTFRPAINKNAMIKKMVIDTTRPVHERLLQYAIKLNEKKRLQFERSQMPIDQNTGQKLFTPLTGRRPQSDVSFFASSKIEWYKVSAPIVNTVIILGCYVCMYVCICVCVCINT